METFTPHWNILDPFSFVLNVLILSLLVRCIHAGLAGIKFAYERKGTDSWLEASWWVFRGFAPSKAELPNNYWYSYVIGTAELAAYPILLATGAITVIGAWIGLKTLAQWNVWTSDRNIFNLFLIGNLLTIFFSVYLQDHVTVLQPAR